MNKFRNEVTIELNGNSYLLRGTFGALVEIEDEVGKTIPVILNEVVLQRDMSPRVILAVILYGARASGLELDEDQLKRDIEADGISSCVTSVVRFLTQAMEGGEQVKKKK